jgi:hypothetical protein
MLVRYYAHCQSILLVMLLRKRRELLLAQPLRLVVIVPMVYRFYPTRYRGDLYRALGRHSENKKMTIGYVINFYFV